MVCGFVYIIYRELLEWLGRDEVTKFSYSSLIKQGKIRIISWNTNTPSLYLGPFFSYLYAYFRLGYLKLGWACPAGLEPLQGLKEG